MSTFNQGQHVIIDTGSEKFKAIILEIKGAEVVAQEFGTQRVEIFALHMCRLLS
jgi:hypothetical protein